VSGVLRVLYICAHKRLMPTLRDITHPRFGTYAVDKPFTHNGRTWRIIGRDEDGYILRNEETGLRKSVSEEQMKQAQ
jgi:hypothetical protein